MLGRFRPTCWSFIAQKVQSNIRELEGSLNRISAYAMLHGRPVSTELAAEALADLMAPTKGTQDPEAILNAVARHFGVSLDDLRGKSRHEDDGRATAPGDVPSCEDASSRCRRSARCWVAATTRACCMLATKWPLRSNRDAPSRGDARAIRDLIL